MAETNDPVERSESLPVSGLPLDWHVLATEKVVSTVDTVRVKTSGPAIKVSRAVVFGLMGAFIGLMAVILLLIGLVRLLDNILPEELVDLVRSGNLEASAASLVSLVSERMASPRPGVPSKPDDLTFLLYRRER